MAGFSCAQRHMLGRWAVGWISGPAQLASLCRAQPAQPFMGNSAGRFPPPLTTGSCALCVTLNSQNTIQVKKEAKPSVSSKPFSIFDTHDTANEIIYLPPEKKSRNCRYYYTIVFPEWDHFGRKERTAALWYRDFVSIAPPFLPPI